MRRSSAINLKEWQYWPISLMKKDIHSLNHYLGDGVGLLFPRKCFRTFSVVSSLFIVFLHRCSALHVFSQSYDFYAAYKRMDIIVISFLFHGYWRNHYICVGNISLKQMLFYYYFLKGVMK